MSNYPRCYIQVNPLKLYPDSHDGHFFAAAPNISIVAVSIPSVSSSAFFRVSSSIVVFVITFVIIISKFIFVSDVDTVLIGLICQLVYLDVHIGNHTLKLHIILSKRCSCFEKPVNVLFYIISFGKFPLESLLPVKLRWSSFFNPLVLVSR